MNDKKLEKQKKNLITAGLMSSEETLIAYVQASYVDKLIGKIGQWKQGWAYFTDQKLIVPTGVLDENIVIPYQMIRGISKCNQGIFPMGIAITHDDLKTGGTIEDRISLSKRQKWIDFLSEKSGVACS